MSLQATTEPCRSALLRIATPCRTPRRMPNAWSTPLRGCSSARAELVEPDRRLFRLIGSYVGTYYAHDLLAQSLGRGIQHDFARPLDDEGGNRSGRFDGDIEAHPGLIDAHPLQ